MEVEYFILTEPTLLVNETSVDLEGSSYTHTLKVEIIDTNNLINNLKYSIEETTKPPEGINITEDGRLYGRLDPIIPNDIPRINIDGSGRENINRFNGNDKIVDFKIRLDYNISIPEIIESTEPTEEEGSTPTEGEETTPVITYKTVEGYQIFNVSIRIVKNNDIDNYVFMVGYLMSRESVVNGTIVKHTIDYNGVTYDESNVLELLKNHPGPFGV